VALLFPKTDSADVLSAGSVTATPYNNAKAKGSARLAYEADGNNQ
jgi:hypothetical protein